MIKSLLTWFDRLAPAAPGEGGTVSEHDLQLASAVMLVEVMRADTHFDSAERQAVLSALQAKFSLTPEEAQALSERAEQAAHQATDLFSFTEHLNARLDMPCKLRIIEHMWTVAYADGVLSDHERHVVWRVADLLHVPQGAYVHARMRAQAAATSTG